MRLKLSMKGGHTESLFSAVLPQTNKPQPRLMVSSLMLALMTLVTMCWLLTGPGRAKQRGTKNRTLSPFHPHPQPKAQPTAAGSSPEPTPPPGFCCWHGPPAMRWVPRESIESHRQSRRPREEEGRLSIVRGERQCLSPRDMVNLSPELCLGGCGDQACVWALPSRLHIK